MLGAIENDVRTDDLGVTTKVALPPGIAEHHDRIGSRLIVAFCETTPHPRPGGEDVEIVG